MRQTTTNTKQLLHTCRTTIVNTHLWFLHKRHVVQILLYITYSSSLMHTHTHTHTQFFKAFFFGRTQSSAGSQNRTCRFLQTWYPFYHPTNTIKSITRIPVSNIMHMHMFYK